MLVYTLITVGTVGLLVLLRVDGLSNAVVTAVGVVALIPPAILLRFARDHAAARKWLERYSGAAFVALVIAHFVLDRK